MSSAIPFVGGDVLSGRYELDRRVAQGGFGKVWRATYLVLARPVAIKLPARRQEQGSSGSPAAPGGPVSQRGPRPPWHKSLPRDVQLAAGGEAKAGR
ncbi:MAG TPA: hypothetical protein VF983_06530 [Streptosporangiaceae bacterium]